MPNNIKSFWLGSLGVLLFALTLPMTRLATGSAVDPALSPWFVSFGRAALAGVFSIVYLLVVRPSLPKREDFYPLTVAAICNVLGWPILLAFGLLYVESVHASVITGILPLATAAMAALVFRRKPSPGFWLFAMLGALLVVIFAWIRGNGASISNANVHWADFLILMAVLCAAVGYAVGGRLSQRWPGEIVICWMLILLMPITLTGAIMTWPTSPIPSHSWWGFLYVSIFSMWLGMFVWYRALAMGDAIQVSQLQLAQPFLSIMFSVPLLGESVDAITIMFGLGVVVTVYFAKRMSIYDQVEGVEKGELKSS